MTNKKNKISAIFTASIALAIVFAALPTTNEAYATTSRSGSTTWFDCVGQTMRGTFQVTVNTPPVTSATFQATNWPSSYWLGGDFCAFLYNYTSQQDKLTDNTAGWTFTHTYIGGSPTHTSTDALGHTIQYNDSISASEATTYNNSSLGNQVRTVNLGPWNAT